MRRTPRGDIEPPAASAQFPAYPAGTMDNPEDRHMNKWALAILLGAVALFMYFSIIWKTY